MLIDKRLPPPPRAEGLRPAGMALNQIVKNLQRPLDLKRPRSLEKVR